MQNHLQSIFYQKKKKAWIWSNLRFNYSFQEIWKIEENVKGHYEHEIQNLQNDTGKTTNFFQLINIFLKKREEDLDRLKTDK